MINYLIIWRLNQLFSSIIFIYFKVTLINGNDSYLDEPLFARITRDLKAFIVGVRVK